MTCADDDSGKGNAMCGPATPRGRTTAQTESVALMKEQHQQLEGLVTLALVGGSSPLSASGCRSTGGSARAVVGRVVLDRIVSG